MLGQPGVKMRTSSGLLYHEEELPDSGSDEKDSNMHDKTQESESETHEEELIVESNSYDKVREEKEVEVKVQEEGGEENQDKLEGDGNDDAGLEVYGKDSKEMSIPELSIASQGKVKAKAGGMQKDTSKVSTCDDLKVSQSKCHAKCGKQKTKRGVAKGGDIQVMHCQTLT
eukprot:15365690-Ditylum_brightwellii.AAC.1